MELKDMQGHFSHFGFKDEDLREGEVVESSKDSTVDGYGVGDRMLDGINFEMNISDSGVLSANTPKDTQDYMKQLNEPLWIERALDYSIQNDVFGDDDRGLIMDDGRYNWEWCGE